MPNCSPTKAGAQATSSSKGWQKARGSCFRRRTAAASSALLLTACTSIQLPAGPNPLDPIAFFTGETRGHGTLNPLVGKSVTVTVHSRGSVQGGALRLVQRIQEGEKPARTRTWIMQPLGNGRYGGTLTDAVGPVSLTVAGPRAQVSYTTPSGVRIRQQLALQADGRTLLNHLEAFKYGVRVATLDEIIRKVP